MEWTWDKEHFLTVDETIIVRVGFVGVGEEVVRTCDDFLAVFQTIVSVSNMHGLVE